MSINFKCSFNSTCSGVFSGLAISLPPAYHPVTQSTAVYRLVILKHKYVHVTLTLKCLTLTFAFKMYYEPFSFKCKVLYTVC